MAGLGDHKDDHDKDDDDDECVEAIGVRVGARWPRPEERETRLQPAPNAQHHHPHHHRCHHHHYLHFSWKISSLCTGYIKFLLDIDCKREVSDTLPTVKNIKIGGSPIRQVPTMVRVVLATSSQYSDARPEERETWEWSRSRRRRRRSREEGTTQEGSAEQQQGGRGAAEATWRAALHPTLL